MSIKPIDNRSLRLLRGLLLLVLLAGGVRPAIAWDNEGHQIIGILGSRFLTPAAKREVDRLLEGRSLAEIAPQPDVWRRDQPHTAIWHFVEIPLAASGYDQVRDCAPQESEVGKGCAVAAIEHFRAELANPQASRENRVRALIFLVHLVGDIHQPLHSADNDDRGGNMVRLTFFGDPTSLHAVWDAGMIARSGLSAAVYADSILSKHPEIPASEGTIVDWVNASHALARKVYPGETTLGDRYYFEQRERVERQLLLAGVHLAALLNDTLAHEEGKIPGRSG
jgi:hypothetical protein